MTRPIVVIESPYAADDPAQFQLAYHRAYLQACIRDSILVHGEIPFASHQMYTDALDDDEPSERELGILAGLVFATFCGSSIFYIDLGMSPGMSKYGLPGAEKACREIVYRKLGGVWTQRGAK